MVAEVRTSMRQIAEWLVLGVSAPAQSDPGTRYKHLPMPVAHLDLTSDEERAVWERNDGGRSWGVFLDSAVETLVSESPRRACLNCRDDRVDISLRHIDPRSALRIEGAVAGLDAPR